MTGKMARNIRAYWRRQGYEVMVMVVGEQGRSVIVSSLVNGLPPQYQGELTCL